MSKKKCAELDAHLDAHMEDLQRESFNYILKETNPANGLVIDRTAENWPASIAATGLGLSAYPVAVERGYMTRAAAVERTLATLRFFFNSHQGPEPDATGYKGFYYHFLDLKSGKRAWQCELSTVDSTLLLAGILSAGIYFSADVNDEKEIGRLADALFRRVDLAVGPEWRQDGHARLEARERISSLSLGRLRRSVDPVCPGIGFAHISFAGRQLYRLGIDV